MHVRQNISVYPLGTVGVALNAQGELVAMSMFEPEYDVEQP